MYSEKLKKLIEAKTQLKFRIKDRQQSKELQEFLFALGMRWCDGENCVRHEEAPFLFAGDYYPYFRSDYRLFHCDYDDEKYFNELPDKEFDLENDCLVEEKKEEKPWYDKLEVGKECKTKNKKSLRFVCKIPFDVDYPLVFLARNEIVLAFNLHGVYSVSEPDNTFDIDLSQFDEPKKEEEFKK